MKTKRLLLAAAWTTSLALADTTSTPSAARMLARSTRRSRATTSVSCRASPCPRGSSAPSPLAGPGTATPLSALVMGVL